MNDLHFQAWEEAARECDGKPTDEAVQAKYQEAIERLYDRADDLRKREREEGY